MKRIYVFLFTTFSLLFTFGVFANNFTSATIDDISVAKTRQIIEKVDSKDNPSLNFKSPMHQKSGTGKTAYGFCASDRSWSEDGRTEYGLYSFNTESPGEITKLWTTNQPIDAGAYYDGYYYVQTSVMEGSTYTSMKFGRYNAITGDYEEIADWTASKPRFTDFTVDYSTEPPQLIGLQYGLSATQRKLVRINMSTGALTSILSGNTTGTFFAIACSYDGTVYVLNSSGRLQRINKTTGSASNVGTVATGITPKFAQSMEFDHTDGKLYWASFSSTNEGKFGTINTTTGAFTSLGTLGNNAEFTGLYVPFVVGVPGTPGKITNLTITPAANGGKSADLKWNNPVKDNTGTIITSPFSINIYRNGAVVATINNQISGAECTYTDNVPSSAVYTYKVTAVNEFGESLSSTSQLFVGEDIPKGPTNITLTASGYNAILNWTPPTIGGSNGWINTNQLTYKITRNPGSVVIAENATGNTYTDNSIKQLAYYSYSIQAKTTAGDGGVATSNALNIGPPLSVPYTCDFNTDQFPMWTVIDANDDYSTWTGNGAAQYSSWGMYDANDWLISPPINMAVGKYKLSFDYNAKSSSDPEKFKIFFGKGATVEAQVTELANYDNVVNTISLTKTLIFDITQADVYNFSFYVYSVANYSGLTIDNFKLERMGNNDLSATSVSGSVLPMVGKEYWYNVSVYNGGIQTQSTYSVQLIDESGSILATTNVVPEIPMNATRVVAVNWIPENEGVTLVRGKVVLSNDEIPSNDISPAITVTVQPAGGDEMVLIGDGNEESVTMPFDFYYKSSVTQTIYLNSEIGLENGLVKKIIYPYRNGSFRGVEFEKPVKIYMANTNLSNTNEGWIPQEQLTQVFDGNITIVEEGQAQMIITLDTPFIYTGGNLCVMTVRPMDFEFVNGIYFYLSSMPENRTRQYLNDYIEFDWTQEGTTSKNIPQVILQIAELGAAKIAGTISSDGMPLEGVKITMDPLGMVTTTDAEGNYEFAEVPADTYSLTAVKHGYADSKVTGVVVAEYLTTTRNISMNKRYKFSVSGIVRDADGVNIEGAEIHITGYDTYNSTTGATGTFLIPEVYSAQNYTLKVTKKGYENTSLVFHVTSETTIPTITMIVVSKPAERVAATATSQKVDITWDAPSQTTFRYDDGIEVGGLNPVYPPSQYGVMGTVYRTPAILNNMSWWTVDNPFMGAPHENVNIFVFDLNEQGEPTNTIIFNQMNVSNKDAQWNIFTFPTPLECPRGFMVAISYFGIMGLGHDSGRSVDWPFVPSGNYSCPNYLDKPFSRMPGDMPYNLMVRAEGNQIDDSKAVSYPLVKGYKVWRLAEQDAAIESKWTELTPTMIDELTYTDNSWATVDNGTYKYAVKAIYAGGVISTPTLSNMVAKGMEATVTINVNTNTTPNDSDQASITLTNSDNNSQHIYTGTVDASGKSIIQNVWKGTYKITIRKEGYKTFEVSGVEIKTDQVALNYTLEEIVIVPFNLEIVENEYPSERIFTWSSTPSKALKRYEVYLNDAKVADVMTTSYMFTALENGSYTAGVKAVYASTTTEMVTIPFEVTGQAVAAPVFGTVVDIEAIPVADVNVKITGKRTYTVETDQTGAFYFPAVMAGSGYTVTLSKNGYDNHVQTFTVTAGVDLNLGEILLKEKTYTPRKVKAIEESTNVNISWIDGAAAELKTFRYDDGNAINGLGSPNGDDMSVVGNVFRTPASLTEMSWVTVGNATKVNVFVFDLTETGEPTNTILFSELNVTNKASSASMIWNKLIFPTEIDCPRGFFLAVSIAAPAVGNVALGFDAGTSTTWPFVPNVGYYNGDYSDPSTLQYIGSQFPGNLMIRASGYENSRNPIVDNSKSLTGYKVWRLSEADQSDESKWTLLTPNTINQQQITDNKWSELTYGTYKYAVKAVYTGGTTSTFGFSNTIIKNSEYTVTVTQAPNGTIVVKNNNAVINSGDKVLGNTELTIVATPESSKYILDYITVNGVSITGNKYTVTGDVNISAVFIPDLSIDNLDFNAVNIYPNPVKDVLNVSGQYESLEIYDLTGRLIINVDGSQEISHQGVSRIDMSQCASGTYIVKLRNAGGFKNYKITKQ